MFDYRAVIARAMKQQFFDTSPGEWAELLQIKVERVASSGPHWEAICGYHLPNSGGNPNIYLSGVTEQGLVVHEQTTGQTMVFGWDWVGRKPTERHAPVRGDKQLSEPSANINLGKGQIVTTWVEDSIPSDRVSNLRSDWPQALYHTATFVCFRLTSSGGSVPPPDPTPDPDEIERAFNAGFQAGQDSLVNKILEVIGRLS